MSTNETVPTGATMLIGEVSRRTGISARMLRHYDAIGLLAPAERSAGDYRRYSPADLQRLLHIESLRSLGLRLTEVKRALDEGDPGPAEVVDQLVVGTRARIRQEQELLHRLHRVRAGGPADWTEVLRIIALLRGLDSADPQRRQRVALTPAGPEGLPVREWVDAVLGEDDPNVAGALRWALARSAGDPLPLLAAALDAPDGETRRRAVTAIAELDTAAALEVLTRALEHPDPAVRGRAAVAVGSKGIDAARAALIGLVADGVDDVAAAEALGVLAAGPGVADRIVAEIAERLHRVGATGAARGRLAQALGELPTVATRELLTTLAGDPEPRVALTAVYLLRRSRTGR